MSQEEQYGEIVEVTRVAGLPRIDHLLASSSGDSWGKETFSSADLRELPCPLVLGHQNRIECGWGVSWRDDNDGHLSRCGWG